MITPLSKLTKTEVKVYGRIRPWLALYGFPQRIENVIGSGLTDVFYIVQGRIYCIELKLMPAWQITVRPTQITTAIALTKRDMPPNQYVFACWKEKTGLLYVYSLANLRAAPQYNLTDEKLVINMEDCTPVCLWRNHMDIRNWLDSTRTTKPKET